ncbi:recombinase family protein [Thiomicrospira sp.]|uniref:recombinase family protein n=1 Tax=Thiomicrospira sp. TaxID=935 RepID=UPI002F92D8AC
MAIVGYARVSSVGQKLDVQLEKLKTYGCEKIFEEKVSGTTANRVQLHRCLEYLREGDSLVITKLDRLARSTFHLTQISNLLEEKSVDFVVLDQQIDTSTPTGKLLFNMLASIAEFETEIRKERQLEGIEKAKSKGVKFGAKKKLTEQEIEQMTQEREAGVLVKDLAKKYGISIPSVYRLIGGEMDLQRALNSVGKTCFVKYYEEFASDKPVEDIVEILLNKEGYAETASRTRVNNARKIIRQGLSAEALGTVISSNHALVAEEIKQKAIRVLESN